MTDLRGAPRTSLAQREAACRERLRGLRSGGTGRRDRLPGVPDLGGIPGGQADQQPGGRQDQGRRRGAPPQDRPAPTAHLQDIVTGRGACHRPERSFSKPFHRPTHAQGTAGSPGSWSPAG